MLFRTAIMPMAVMAMMPAMPAAARGMMVVMIVFAGVAVFADIVQREFIAHADIDFAHSYSLQNTALLAASSRSSINHQTSRVIIK